MQTGRPGITQLALALLLLIAGCSSARMPALTTTDQAAIYAAVIERLYGVENGVIPNNFPVLYLVQATQQQPGDEPSTALTPVVFSAELKQGIEKQIEELPAQLIWVASSEAIPWDQKHEQVKDGGAGISLGIIQQQPDGKVQLAGGIVVANMGAYGAVFILEKQDGVWKVTGTTGPQWIS